MIELADSANDDFCGGGYGAAADLRPPINLPEGHVGPVLLSGTGRMIWWTGRVAIGLRYEVSNGAASAGQSAQWVQDLLLHPRKMAA